MNIIDNIEKDKEERDHLIINVIPINKKAISIKAGQTFFNILYDDGS
jgi:hypothetical protein